ncbi:MAG: hypothetical protein NTZ07_00815 [Candidatus Woesebacteria bacterium]|nr:hypothetical protein [Candidatus Woesebacteria bacterium]
MNIKKLAKITLVGLSVLSIVWIISIYLKGAPKKSSGIVPGKPNLVKTYKGNLSIYLNIKEGDFKYTGSLPFLSVTKKVLTEDYLNKVASFMGFSGTSTKINDTQEGLTYFWKSDKATFFAYTNTSKIRYSSGEPFVAPNKQLSEDAVKATIENFIAGSSVLSANSYSLGSVQFLKEGSLNEGFKKSTKDDFSLYQVNILPKSTEYEIVSPTSTESTSYIQLTKDGNIYSLQLVVFGDVQRGPTEYTIKTYKEVNDSIANSVLISLDGEETPIQYLTVDYVKEIVINRIDIAYLLDSVSSTNLQPVYKLTGVATLSNTKGVQAILYLPALSGL